MCYRCRYQRLDWNGYLPYVAERQFIYAGDAAAYRYDSSRNSGYEQFPDLSKSYIGEAQSYVYTRLSYFLLLCTSYWNLRALHVGDKVVVMDTGGKSWTFRVNRVALYPPQQAPVQEIFGNEAGHYLNLITCAGDWIPSQHQTTLRLVVFTTLVS
ncbi:MAG TPA: hypothetical protein DCS90_03745 [Ktedonobacter sp.]|nr:hypothetical protein [Ktedonobacter sp.]